MPRVTVQQRSDPTAAEAVIRAVFLEVAESALESYVQFAVGAIKYLASRHNDRWGVTLFEWGVRLNAGWVECLILHDGGLRVLVEGDIAPAHTRFDGVSYERAPGCEMTTVPLSDLALALPTLEEAHHAALSRAAHWQSPLNIRRAHSVGVTKFLSQFAREYVPDPSYVPWPDRAVLAGRDEELKPSIYSEGGRVAALVNRFERDPGARDACIAYHGSLCAVCGMSFGDRYGEAMKHFIHVHHLRPLSAIGVKYQIDPVNELRPVCPNCHAVIHHSEPPLSIEQARALLVQPVFASRVDPRTSEN